MKVINVNRLGETILYNGTDSEHLKRKYHWLNPVTIDLLCEHLEETNKELKIIPCYDAQSGWHGEDWMIGRANLAYNGYCLNDNSILKYIGGGHDNKWYRFYDPEYIKT